MIRGVRLYKSFKIQNFRGFDTIEVKGMKKVNLITGMNNVGKTAFLEALFIHCGGYNVTLTKKIDEFRGFQTIRVEKGDWAQTPWDYLFTDFDSSKRIILSGVDTKTKSRQMKIRVIRDAKGLSRIANYIQASLVDDSKIMRGNGDADTQNMPPGLAQVLELESVQNGMKDTYYFALYPDSLRMIPFPPAPPFPGYYQTSRATLPTPDQAEKYGKLQLSGKDHFLLDSLKIIEPNLERLEMVYIAGQAILHGAKSKSQLIPISLMGEGMMRLTNIILGIGTSPGGVVLIDEIDIGIHHSLLTKVWKAISKASEFFDTQIFATTHSRECIIAAHKAFSETNDYNFRLYRFERTDDGIESISYDKEEIDVAIQTNLEIR